MAEKWYWLAAASLLLGIPGMLLELFMPACCGVLVQVMPLIALPLLRYALALPWPCAGLGAAVSGAVWGILLLADCVFCRWGSLRLGPVSAMLAAAVLLYFRRYALVPDHCGQFLRNERGPSKLTGYLWSTAVALYVLSGWIVYLLFQRNGFTFPQLAALWAFSACILMVLLPLIRGCALHFVDQVEGLIDRQYQAELMSFMQVIRSQRHDFNFHLQTLSGLIGRGAYGECQAYIDTMVRNAGKINDVLLIRSPALGAMLGTFLEIAQQKGIDLSLSIQNEMEHVPCTVYELNTIVGNLIQNALDEVEQHHLDALWVRVLLMKRGGNNVVRVTNPFGGDPDLLSRVLEPGFSTKKAHEGIGLTTVQRILTRHGGVVYPEFLDGAVSFIAQFPIAYQTEEKRG
ncbi:MAG: GHKL domain-containing protein [Oscillospiraceae bacterium]|nr:GHKL domain-containing protein [Oscillospiraceae bacterium]